VQAISISDPHVYVYMYPQDAPVTLSRHAHNAP